MTDDHTTKSTAETAGARGDALEYARTLLAAEDERAVAMRRQVPSQLWLAWAWFGFVQLTLFIVVAVTGDDYNDSHDLAWETIAIIVAALAAATIIALTTAAARFWSLDDAVPSAFEGLPTGAAEGQAAPHSEILKATSAQLQARRVTNARRGARLSNVRSAWVATMVLTLGELATVVAALADKLGN